MDDVFTNDMADELTHLYKKKQDVSVVTYLVEDEGALAVEVLILGGQELRHIVQQERVTIEFAPYDYDEFINGRILVRKKVISEFLYQEINKRIHSRYYEEIEAIYNKRDEELRRKEQHARDRESILTKVRSRQYEGHTKSVIQNSKYAATGETKTLPSGVVLQRIKSQQAFVLASGKNVHKGELGGYIESEHNLSKQGICWVGGSAIVFGEAQVLEEAEVSGHAMVKDRAVVKGRAVIFGHAVIEDQAQVMGKASVYGKAKVQEQSKVGNRAIIKDRVRVMQSAQVGQYVQLGGDVRVVGNAILVGDDVYEGTEVLT